MKTLFTIFYLTFFTNVITTDNSKLTGKWQEYTVGVNGEPEIIDDGYKIFLIITKIGGELSIVQDYSGVHSRDFCDNIFFDGEELTFRKRNKRSGTFNHFKLSLIEDKGILKGTEKSWNGNIYQVKYKKIK
jgi:hypothetical protein